MERLFDTRITRLFNVRTPIVAGCMQHLSTPRYVAAAADCGMMAFLSAASFPDPEDLRSAIRRCRELVGERPFGVNVSMLPKLVEGEQTERTFELLAAEKVPFVETSGRSPEPYLAGLQAAGIKVLHKVPTVRHARKAQALGVDAVAVVGAECGGHPGLELVGTMVQAAVAARDISIPLVIGGGIGSGAQLVAALALGADGVVIGTRFLVAEELEAHPAYKQRLLNTDETGTTLVLGSLRNTLRALRTEAAQTVARLEAAGGDLEILLPYISGQTGRRVYRSGDVDAGVMAVGQAVAFADRVEPLAHIVARLEREARQAMKRLGQLYAAETVPDHPGSTP